MKHPIKIIDFGLEEYAKIYHLQKALFTNLIDEKLNNRFKNEYLLLGEHFPVITCGRRADQGNILYSEKDLKRIKIDIFNIERGGDVTFHGPGQLIAYPIIDLNVHKLTVKGYVEVLEEAVIRLLLKYGIKGGRIEGATGVWIGKGSSLERKICAIGVKCSRFCTMHGLALNINTDLSGFSMINPCGFKDKGVTSMAKELKTTLDFTTVKQEFSDIFLSLIFPL